MKALVTLFGPREAARQAGIPEGSMTAYAFKYKWKKATGFRPDMKEEGLDVGDTIARAMAQKKQDTMLDLATYARNAAEKAAIHKDPLEVARKVRDVAGVYQVLYPPENDEGLIEGAILIGDAKVTVNPGEVQARAIEVEPSTLNSQLSTSDVRP
jgi:hypothetical protein